MGAIVVFSARTQKWRHEYFGDDGAEGFGALSWSPKRLRFTRTSVKSQSEAHSEHWAASWLAHAFDGAQPSEGITGKVTWAAGVCVIGLIDHLVRR